MEVPKIELPAEIVEAIQEPMKLLSKKYNINRARRCYVSLIYYLSSEEGSKVIIDHYDLYVLAALIIYSKKYGDGTFSYTEATKIEGIIFKLPTLQNIVRILSGDNLFSRLSSYDN